MLNRIEMMSLRSIRNAALGFGAQMVRRLALARREGSMVAILLLDLDGFKDINDSLGYPFGDRLLGAMAQRITTTVRATDTLARLGGDEFALVQPQIRQTAEVLAL